MSSPAVQRRRVEQVAKAAASRRRAQKQYADATYNLNETILKARAAGVSAQTIAETVNLSRQQVHNITKGER
jgi:ribosome-binding protein aMBF1 (putative translation factor)